MLGKLLKYEIRAMGRIMLPLYAVLVFMAGVFALNMRMVMNPSVKSLLEKIALLTGFLFFAAVMVVWVVMFVMVVQRFYRNLLGTEGYLMFSLPVSTLDQILSKGLSALLWIVIGVAAGAGAGFLIVGILSSIPEFLKEMGNFWELFSKNRIGELILVAIVLVVSIMESLCKIYAAMAVGHQAGSHRILASIGAYIGFGLIELAVNAPLSSDGGLFGWMFERAAGGAAVGMSTAMWVGLIQGLVGIAVYGVIAWLLLDRRLNLE